MNYDATASSAEKRKKFFDFFICFQTIRSKRGSQADVLFELAKAADQAGVIPGSSFKERLGDIITRRDVAGLFSMLDEVVAHYEQDQSVQ